MLKKVIENLENFSAFSPSKIIFSFDKTNSQTNFPFAIAAAKIANSQLVPLCALSGLALGRRSLLIGLGIGIFYGRHLKGHAYGQSQPDNIKTVEGLG